MTRPPIDDKNSKPGLVGIGPIPSRAPVAAFNIAGIEDLLQTKAFEAYHYRHAPNPDRASLHAPVDPNTQSAHRGVRYYSVRPLGVVPTSFKLEERLQVQGVWGMGTVIFNVTGQYNDDAPEKTVYIRERDLIVLNPTITMMTQQLFEFNPTGPQRLNYRVKGVDYLADDTNIYQEGRDFSLVNGEIVWTETGYKPRFVNGQGAVLTCVYYMTPIYIVQNLPHSLRIIPSNSTGHGALPREAVYAPQLVIAKPSTIMEEQNLLGLYDLPPFPDYRASQNTTGGSV